MKVLFLDDSLLRREVIVDACPHNVELWCVPTVEMFRHSYGKRAFDVVCLDHDLGTEENGMYAVAFLVSLPAERRPLRTLVHSANYPAAGRMIATLNDAACTNVALVPFPDLARVLRKISEQDAPLEMYALDLRPGDKVRSGGSDYVFHDMDAEEGDTILYVDKGGLYIWASQVTHVNGKKAKLRC